MAIVGWENSERIDNAFDRQSWHIERCTMIALKWIDRNSPAVRQASELGEIVQCQSARV